MIGVILLAFCLTFAAAEPADIPYRQFSPTIDGVLSEWREPYLERQFSETAGSDPERNHMRVRMAWDVDALLVAVEIVDYELIAAPAELSVDQFHQYDSAQLYLDARANAGPRMDDDDVDLLLLPDGRSGALRGDSLIGDLAQATVPQRESRPLAVDYASRLTADGWAFELRIPFAGLGVTGVSGTAIGVDVVSNDWLVDHAPGPTQAFTPERVRELAGDAHQEPPPHSVIGTQLLPRNWMGDTDFGYPARWSRLTLTGEPPMLERWSRRFGVVPVLTAIAVAGLLFGIGSSGLTYLWHRRQLRGLLARMAKLPEAATTPTPEPPAPVVAASPPDAEPFSVPDRRDQAFAESVLAYVCAHLTDELSPADLAEQFHVSLRTLQRRLQAGLATSPQDLVLAARLQAARAMLRAGHLRVGDVAAAVGFEDLSHFSRRYRQAYGHPPSGEI